MADRSDFDVIVVGAGMFGSSAAKYIRRMQPSLRVAVVGPDDNRGPLARGQHFDEARICRRVESSAAWAHLNDLGALSYGETEATSGIDFYTPCGCLWVASAADAERIGAALDAVTASSGGADAAPFVVVREAGDAGDAAAAAALAAGKTSVVRVTDSSAAAEAVYGCGVRVGHLETAGEATRYFAESGRGGGGTVHPTRYVEAQLACAAAVAPASHYTRVVEVALHIERSGGDGDDGGAAAVMYAVKTDAERTYRAPRVLVATAAFSKYHAHLPPSVCEQLYPHPIYVVLLRVQPPHDDHAANVQASLQFPSVICTSGAASNRFYALPPRYYADRGGWFVKMGGASNWLSAVKDADVSTVTAAVDWFEKGETVPATHPGAQALAASLAKVYTAWPVLPDTPLPPPHASCHVVRCIFDETADELPLIGCADGAGLHCAVGGCGRGAKTCDPIGCIAAHRLLGKELPPAYAFAAALFHPQKDAAPAPS
ncbi:FAD dependent oxidoreductase [Novymonas esmeraldas]|uniref:FAD dependent oxidoreductase n=1 Tax=Novymonas esmeraldas TaxID=1808958 RepID=A0AAW0F0B4_9TRYP